MLTINYKTKDLSLKLEDYSGAGETITLLSSEVIYIGYYKPINSLYLDFASVVNSSSIVSLKYDTVSGLSDVSELIDHTKGLGESGEISWSVPDSTQVKSTLFGKELYWYRLSVDVDTVARVLRGINVLFSNDKDLSEEYPGIENNLPSGQTSFINFHVAVRKDIVQSLRKKYSANNKMLNQFDLLNNEEVRDASKYLTLAKIFYWLSDAPADKWAEKFKFYYAKGEECLNNITLTIDTNDDGIAQVSEQNNIQFVQVVRV